MIFLLAWHDFRLLMKDKKTVMILIMMPILLMTILGNSLSSSFENSLLDSPLKIAIVKQYEDPTQNTDNWFSGFSSNLSEETTIELTSFIKDIKIEEIFFEDFLGNKKIKEVLSYTFMTLEEANRALEAGQLDGVLILPKDFIKNISISMVLPLRNETKPVLKFDRDSGIRGAIIQSIMSGFFDDLNKRVVTKNTFIEAIALNSNQGPDFNALGKAIQELMEANTAGLVNFELKNIPHVKTVNSISYYAAAMMSMFLLFTAGQGGRMFLEEKEQFTLQRQLVTGLSIWNIVFSKYITLVWISMTQIFAMLVFSGLILKVDWGNWSQVFLIGAFASVAVAGMGIFVGIVTYVLNDFKLANMMESVIIQIMAFLGGSFIPLVGLPGFVEKLSFLTINGLVLKSLLRTMQGFELSSFSSNLLALALVSMGFILAAIGIIQRTRTVSS